MHRRTGRGRLLLLVFLALSIVIITLDYRGNTGPLDRFRDVASAVLSPIQRGLNTVTRPVGNFFSSLGDLASLREDNKSLEAENAILRTKVVQAQSLTDENVELREHIDLDAPWFAQSKVAAEVINDAPGNYRWAVVINRGKEVGIQKDMAVINTDGLVGKIIASEEGQATVLLLIDPKAGAAATTEEVGRSGVTSGNGEGEPISLNLVDKEAEIDVGDRIVTSNFNGGIFPPGIPIGEVTGIGGDPRDSELDIDVEPFVDFSDLYVLEVLLGSGSTVAAGGDG
jgi:rod shape-determining protein MreC